MLKMTLPKWQTPRVALFQRCRPAGGEIVEATVRAIMPASKPFVTCACCTLGYGVDHTKCCNHRWSEDFSNGR